MSASSQYELVDFGDGRKLERFGPYLIDRPAPPADGVARANQPRWREAAARFERTESPAGSWTTSQPLDETWHVRFDAFELELKLTDSGQVGVFPEQFDNWKWIGEQVRQTGQPEVLNLFGYTGGSTLAAAAAGARVVHVDAARSAVAWARRNASSSGLDGAPIRWIVDDALAFARREVKRGRRYDGLILDPPAYGQGPGGERFKLENDLGELVDLCRQLGAGRERFWLVTCHTGILGQPEALVDYFATRNPAWPTDGILRGEAMRLTSSTNRVLHSGAAVRASRTPGAVSP